MTSQEDSVGRQRQAKAYRTSADNLFSLVSQAEFVEQVLVVAPVVFDFDEEFQMAAMAQQVFDVPSCLRTDIFQAAGAFANHDLFL